MPVKKRERCVVHLRLQIEAGDALREMAEAENRTLTSMMEVMILNAYKEWRSSAGEQLRPDADR